MNLYQLINQISKNDLFDSWVAKEKNSGKPCFLKLLNQNVDHKFGLEALAKTAALQKSLHWKKIITAKRKGSYEGREGLEYPYYPDSTWTALTPEILWNSYREILPQMFQLIDYLHLHEIVHGDIKIENFLVTTSRSKPRVHLGDLDFLTPTGSKPENRLIGTYGLIAPEIISNEGIYIETDIYALGKSLQQSLDNFLQTTPHSPIPKEALAHLQELIGTLSEEDRYRRPRVLLDLMISGKEKQNGIKLYEQERRQVLRAFLHSCIKNSSPNLLTAKNSANHFVRVKCRLFGIPTDIIDLHKEKAKRNRAAAWRSLLRTLQRSSIEQLGDYWHVGIPREEIFKTLTESKQVTPLDSITNTDTLLSTALSETDKHERNEHYWSGLFVCTSALAQLDSSGKTDAGNRAQLFTRMAHYAQRLYMHTDAERTLGTLVSMDALPIHERISHLIDLALVQIRSGNRWQEAKSTLLRGLELVPANQQAEALRLKQLLSWIEMSLGNRAEAERLANETLDESRKQDIGEVVIKTLYVLGFLRWHEGKYPQAISFYEQSVQEGLERNLLSDAVTSLATLALASCEVGSYSKALTYSKQFLRSMDPKKHHSLLPSSYHTLAFAYVRLGKFKKASYWLQRYLEIANAEAISFHLFSHAQYQTFLKLNSGDITSVHRWASQGLAFGNGPAMRRITGKFYHNLAEAELMSGQLVNCLAHINKGRELLSEINDETSIAELELIRFVARTLYDQPQNEAELVSLISTLHRHRSTYYASLGYFYLLALYPSQRNKDTAAKAKILLSVDDEDNVPLFSALSKLCDSYITADESPDTEIFAWKQAFLILNQGHQRFLALLSCNVLIDLLNRENRFRQAYRYTAFAKSISAGLGNNLLAGIANQRTPNVTVLNGQTEELVASFHAVSELLNNITDYTSTLNALLRFAVNLSGAERGVLLAPGSTATGLRVIAAIGCDDQSQADATNISRTLIDEKLKESTPTPLVVDNAMEDMRTNKYSSIMRFNIHSVIVIPLVVQNKSIGVLYLDHHVIPGVFREDDVKYVKAIANFIAPTFAAVQDIRTIKVESEQSKERGRSQRSEWKFISNDPTIAKLYEHLPRAAASNLTVVLRGESGTGKELIAEDIHRRSQRSNRPLIKLNCAAIPATLIESTLFGAVKGAATMITAQEGRLAAADGGTLFLDEIGDMALDVQTKLLRAIEYQEFQPVGTNRTFYTDIRFICATNKNLEDMVEKKQFSPDLYYRISAITLNIPPLRDRQSDIPLLLDHFLDQYLETYGNSVPRFTLEVKNLLHAYPWPGNVRELKNFVESICIMHPGAIVDIDLLKEQKGPMVTAALSRYNQQSSEAAEKAMLADLLRKSGNNQSEAARMFNVPLSTLRRKLRKYSLL